MTVSDLNRLVMNYLIVEGYKDAAEHFSVESGLEASVDFGSIRERMEIRNAVEAGNIEAAIEKVNDLDPEVCSLQVLWVIDPQEDFLLFSLLSELTPFDGARVPDP